MKPEICYVVKLKFTRPGRDGDVYLGDCGKWCSLYKAQRFPTVRAAENELLCNMNRLRRSGLEAAMLSVVPLNPGYAIS